MAIILDDAISELDKVINENNTFVKRGSSDSLERKYFYISKAMENFIEEFVKHRKEEFISAIKKNPSLLIVDVFAGSGNFTLMFTKYLLQMLKENNFEINTLKIILNDKMYDSQKMIDSQKLYDNFISIQNNLKQCRLSIMTNYDLSKNSFQHYREIKEKYLDAYADFSTICIANPMIIAQNKDNKHLKPISFSSESEMMKNRQVKLLVNRVLEKFDFFIYLTKQIEPLEINKFQKVHVYKNDYSELTVTELEKTRYKLILNGEINEYSEENFWKYSKNQDEKFNTIVFYINSSQEESTSNYKYAYNSVYDARSRRVLQAKIKQIKDSIKNESIENLSYYYEKLKGQL